MLIPHQSISVRPKDLLAFNKDYQSLKEFIPLSFRYWTSSGRNALKLILKDTKAARVGLPSFTCKVVDRAVKSAGCKPIYIDSGAVVNIKEIKQVIKNIDTLIIPYNFGFIPEIDKIAALCKKNQVTLIEDCCAALGTTYKQRLAGTFGDYAIYSFGISKGGFIGGMVASNNEMSQRENEKFPPSVMIKNAAQALISKIAFNPKLYPVFYKRLQKDLQKEQKSFDCKFPKSAEKINLSILRRHRKVLAVRRRNANLLAEELDGVIDFVTPIKDSNPSWLYFVFMVKNREEFMRRLLKEKIDLIPLFDYKDLSEKGTRAKESEQKHLTLSLNRPLWQIEYIIKKIKKVCENGDY